MSSATTYLVQQIRDKDELINSLLAQMKERERLAWNDGWHEQYLEWERQKADPTHPITSNNPHGASV